MLMVVKYFLWWRSCEWHLEKEHIIWIIHMEGACLVNLIKKSMKALFGLVIELFYHFLYTNKYFFTLYIIVQDFITNICHQIKKEIYWWWQEWWFPKQKVRKLHNSKTKWPIQINIMLLIMTKKNKHNLLPSISFLNVSNIFFYIFLSHY